MNRTRAGESRALTAAHLLVAMGFAFVATLFGRTGVAVGAATCAALSLIFASFAYAELRAYERLKEGAGRAESMEHGPYDE